MARGQELTQDERDELARELESDPVCGALKAVGWAPVGGLEERTRLLRRTARFCPACSLEIAGFSIEARVSLEELWRVYLPLCSALREGIREPPARTLVGIAGPPGSGKSVFAALLCTLLNCVAENSSEVGIVVPLDGFHFPNAYLGARFVAGADGARRSLRSRKGAPETFDVHAFVRALDLLGTEDRVMLPRYDRRVHDPVEGGIAVEPHHRLVLVEGNYLLLQEGAWQAVAARLDLRLFLCMPLNAAGPGLIERQVRGGRAPEDAERHFAEVDRPNYDLCMRSAGRADLIIERSADQRITSVKRGTSGSTQ